MGEKNKRYIMAKIPKNLSDKDMLKNYGGDDTLEEKFLAEEARVKKLEQQKNPAKDISIAYLTPDIIEKLGKLLLELKVNLYKDGIVDYTIDAKIAGNKIILEPIAKAKITAKKKNLK